jgi:rhodanese-related sulfurtransferase
MNAFRQALVILAVTLIPSVLTAAFHPRRPAWVQAREGEVSLTTVREWGPAVLWVDARPQAEYQAQHVPGAIALSLEDWEIELPRFLDQWDSNRKVVVYCSSTTCELSHEVGERLKQNGISSVYVLQGGWDTLRESGIVR